MRGRKPKTAEVHKANGNPSKKSLKSVPAKSPSAFKPSKTLKADKRAHAEWKKIVGDLGEQLSVSDLTALEIYCLNVSNLQEIQEAIAGIKISDNGVPHVYLKDLLSAQKKLWDIVRVGMQEFGLTPTSRARLKPVDHDFDDGDELDDLIDD